LLASKQEILFGSIYARVNILIATRGISRIWEVARQVMRHLKFYREAARYSIEQEPQRDRLFYM
jgi:hypothetical protein